MKESVATDPRIGSTLLGVWGVRRNIGIGGMGAVYEVQHVVSQERRAMKIINSKWSRDASAVSRLLREAAVTGSVKSPHIVRTLSTGVLDDRSSYLMMELLEGRTLAERLRAEGRLPVTEVVRLAGEVAQGLAAAHAAGVVHRDLTPKNIFLVREDGLDHAKIVDFGLSKHVVGMTDRFGHLTQTGAFVGTPYYVSPEQAGGRRVDARTDQYGLAVILYECLSGARPYQGDSLLQVLGQIALGEHVPLTVARPELRPEICRAISLAMRVDPEDRYPDVITFARELAQGNGESLALDVSYANTGQVQVLPSSRSDNPEPTGAASPAMKPRSPTAVAIERSFANKPPPRKSGGMGCIGVAIAIFAIAIMISLGVTFGAIMFAFDGRRSARAVPVPVSSDEGSGRELDEETGSQEDEQIRSLRALSDRREFRACIGVSQLLPRTERILEMEIECAQGGHQSDVGRQACQQLEEVSPNHYPPPYCVELLGRN